MELKFNPMRFKIIRKLKGLTIEQVEEKMREIGGYKNRMNIDRWDTGHCNPSSFEKVELLAKALGVPIGFFYYNNVSINMNDLEVSIYIHDTKEEIRFHFLENNTK